MNKRSKLLPGTEQNGQVFSRLPTSTKSVKPSFSFEQRQQLLLDIYDAALDENYWPEVIQKLSKCLNSERGALRLLDHNLDDVEQMYSYNRDAAWSNIYNEYYMAFDPWLTFFSHASSDLFVSTHQVLTNKEYESLEFHADFIKPQKLHYGMGGIFSISNKVSCYLSFQRDKKQSGFAPDCVESIRLLSRHIQKSVLINEKTRDINFENHLLRDGLNQINSPLLLVNKSGTILYINGLAEQLIAQQPGISIRNNKLLIRANPENEKLQLLLRHATRKISDPDIRQAGALFYRDPHTQKSVSILVSPVSPEKSNHDTSSGNCALVFLGSNQHHSSISSEIIMSLYDLSPAESRLVEHLCMGLTLEQIAAKFSLSKNTLRSQLRACFGKTGVSRQSDLINQVNSGPASIARFNESPK